MSPDIDPTATLEQKLVAFSEGLTDDELQVLHEVVHLAWSTGSDAEVAGFAMPAGILCDPCGGGEITFPGTYSMLGSLHVTLHTAKPRRPRR